MEKLSAKTEADPELNRIKDKELGQKILTSSEGDDWIRQRAFVRAESEPDYEYELTDVELNSCPELRFKVNPDRFPILRDQAINKKRISIDETLSLMVQDTADTIARLTGETNPPTPRFDAVIYLDKSARPVSWLVNELWNDFTDKPRPEIEEFLSIDRLTWFRAVNLKVDEKGNLKSDYGTRREGTKANYGDFKHMLEKHPIPRSDIARVRLALIPGGIKALRQSMTNEELLQFDRFNPLEFESIDNDQFKVAPELPEWIIEKIFAFPTGLEGKRIMIVDEVKNSGATSDIAKDIVTWAVNSPETEVETHIFWDAGAKLLESGEFQMESAPVWYDHDINPERGKGIGDVNFRVTREEFARSPDLDHLNMLYIAPVRGRAINLAGSEGESSVELMEEFRRLSKIYREGRILMARPWYYDEEKWIEHYEALGITFTTDPKAKNSYNNLKEGLKNKPLLYKRG